MMRLFNVRIVPRQRFRVGNRWANALTEVNAAPVGILQCLLDAVAILHVRSGFEALRAHRNSRDGGHRVLCPRSGTNWAIADRPGHLWTDRARQKLSAERSPGHGRTRHDSAFDHEWR
jgi:hypothetical protein